MKPRIPRRGSYTGRLAFNPDTGFHEDPVGRRVVTFDGGLSWRYARRGDASHNARHQRNVAVVDSTENERLRLLAAHGPEAADAMIRAQQPHHHNPADDDPHREGLRFHPDHEAPFVTSHTDAWKERA